MLDNILITIIVPIYNVQEYLRKCIESIINESYKNIEIILVDDGSTDQSPKICDYYAEIDHRVVVIHKDNGGLVSARKAGTAKAIGDYILNVDGDDWIEEDRVEILVMEGILPDRADMVYLAGYKKDFGSDSVLILRDISYKTYYGEEVKKEIFPLLFNIHEAFQIKIYCNIWTWAIKRELLQEKQKLIDDRIIMSEDAICVWFCLVSTNSVTLIKQSGYHYIQRKSSLLYSMSDNIETHSFRINILYHQLKNYLEQYNVYTIEIKPIFICMIIYIIVSGNYRTILQKHVDYLYPFTKVKCGSRIVVYGAGKCGYTLMKYLVDGRDYQVMLWVDQNIKRPALPTYKVSPVGDIYTVDYDYIVIAVIRSDISKKIKESLVLMGIPEEKIATMDPNVMTEDEIPMEIKCDFIH